MAAETIRNLQGNETKLMFEMINIMERVNAEGDPPEMDGYVIPNYGYVTDRMGGVFVPPITGYTDTYEYKGKYFRYDYSHHNLEYVSVSGSSSSLIDLKSMTLNEWLKNPLQNIKDYIKEIDFKTMSSTPTVQQQSSDNQVATFSMRRTSRKRSVTSNRDKLLESVVSIWKQYYDKDVSESSLLSFNKIYKDNVISDLAKSIGDDNASDAYQKYYSTLTINELNNKLYQE